MVNFNVCAYGAQSGLVVFGVVVWLCSVLWVVRKYEEVYTFACLYIWIDLLLLFVLVHLGCRIANVNVLYFSAWLHVMSLFCGEGS